MAIFKKNGNWYIDYYCDQIKNIDCRVNIKLAVKRFGDCMRLLTMFVALVVLAAPALATEPVSTVLDSKNQLDASRVTALINLVEPAIREYPPHFADDSQRTAIVESMRRAAKELTEQRVLSLTNPELATNVAFVLTMGHNLDLPTPELAQRAFELSLRLDPESRRTNYLFGMFLISTQRGHFDSLQYLQKAFDLGEEGAEYPIALLLVERGQKEAGLKRLEHYVQRHPNDQRVKKVIQGVKDGTLKFHGGA